MIILIYYAIGLISSILVAFTLLLQLRCFNLELFKIADRSAKKSELESELQGVIVESLKPKPAEIIEPESKATDETFNFQSLPPELRLMVYHRMELISKLNLHSIIPFPDKQFIDESCRNIKLLDVSAGDIPDEFLTIKYKKNGFIREETYSGGSHIEALQKLRCFYFRVLFTKLYKVHMTEDKDVKKIIVYDHDNKVVVCIEDTSDLNAFELLKNIQYTSIISQSSIVSEVFDLPRTKSANEVHIKGECTITKDQLYDLKGEKIFLNIPSFEMLELKEYIEKILLNYDDHPLDTFRVRTTESNTAIFVTEMLKLTSENHTNSERFRNFVEEKSFINCFAGDNEECEAMFCLIENGRTITVYVSKSEVLAEIKDEK